MDFSQYSGFLLFLSIFTMGFWLMIFLLTFVIPYWIVGYLREEWKYKKKEKAVIEE
jgi:hypothetical protein|tara:strand:- start:1033 stop:1200 length:168 start_codon:yes stop_codon:yes gene_type:complete